MEKLVRMVQSKYIEGQPPHWQPAARQPALEDTTSSIFTIAKRDLERMSPMEIRDIFRYRHILVTGVDSGRPILFDEDGLEMLGDLDEEVSIQRKSFASHV